MYCVKCGKQTVGDESLCEECKAAEKSAELAKDDASTAVSGPNATMLGFGKGLASIIMGFGVFIVSCVLKTNGAYMHLVAMIFMLLIDVAAIVLALIFGAKAIRTFSTYKITVGKKPYPAFILGIIGVILSAVAAVIVVVFLFVGLPTINFVI